MLNTGQFRALNILPSKHLIKCVRKHFSVAVVCWLRNTSVTAGCNDAMGTVSCCVTNGIYGTTFTYYTYIFHVYSYCTFFLLLGLNKTTRLNYSLHWKLSIHCHKHVFNYSHLNIFSLTLPTASVLALINTSTDVLDSMNVAPDTF